MRMPSSTAAPAPPVPAYVGGAWPLSAGGATGGNGASLGRSGTPSYGASPYGKSVDMVDVCAQIMNSGAARSARLAMPPLLGTEQAGPVLGAI